MLGLIGNPENRRISAFQSAAVALGFPCPPCLSYRQILDDPSALTRFEPTLWRIDSPGENPSVATQFIRLGGAPPDARELAFGEIGFLQEHHRGFCHILDQIAATGKSFTTDPRDIKTMFDKWDTHLLFQSNQIPRPTSLPAPNTLADFRTYLSKLVGSRSLFLKPRHGSSASGVCAFRSSRHAEMLVAPIAIEKRNGRTVLTNSLRVRTYRSLPEIDAILSRLLPQGMIAESWIPKFTLPGGAIDLRVLVIRGRARHWVVRQSRTPMTNLHLGNRRLPQDELREHIGEDKLDEAFHLAERAAACFPTALHAGVDILLATDQRLYVGEINAFGDLLPNLDHQGESAYTAIARACHQ